MNLFEAIFLRKSNRKFKKQKLAEETLTSIESLIRTYPKLYEKIDLQVKLVREGELVQQALVGIGSYGKIIAPHYLLCSTEEKEGSLENLGFAVENLVLQMATRRIATCWIGVAGKLKKNALENAIALQSNQKPIVLIAFGEAESEADLFRLDIKNIKRKNLDQLVSGTITENWLRALEVARLAPSAGNSQPWRFVVDGRILHVYCAKPRNFLMNKLFGKINFVDTGIALCHLQVATENFGRKVEIKKLTDFPNTTHCYVTSMLT